MERGGILRHPAALARHMRKFGDPGETGDNGVNVRGQTIHVAPGPATGARPIPPGSKYYTLRYVLAAFLAEGESRVRHPARSDDTEVLLAAIRMLGADAAWTAPPPDEPDSAEAALWVRGCAGQPRLPAGGVLSVGNAGAVLRLLLGIGALLPEVRFETPYPDSLGRR